jgi:hypothetical protein
MTDRTCACGERAANSKGPPRCASCKLEGRRAYHRDYERNRRREEASRKGFPQAGDIVTADCRWCERPFDYVSCGRPRFKCDACKKRSGAALTTAWAKRNPDRVRTNHRRYRATTNGKTAETAYNREYRFLKYGVDRAWFDVKLLAQDGRCAICRTETPGGKTNAWHIDHDRSCCGTQQACGKCVRGILCAKCNQGLGQFDDDPQRLLQAATYLASFA